ncbi:MAG: tetratricopeptide repeat protein, partial [Candidatus Acidiferrales bacterium]
MLGVGRRRFFCMRAGIVVLCLAAGLTEVLSGTAAAQTAAPSRRENSPGASAISNTLPQACLTSAHDSEQIVSLLEAIKDHPTAGAYNTLGALYASAGRVHCAIPVFQLSLRLDSKNWEAHYNLALALLTAGDSARAANELRAAIAEKPDSPSAHFALGTLLYNESKFAEAATQFDAVLKIDPNFPGASVSLAQVLVAQGNSAGAIALLRISLAQPPPSEQIVPITVALALTYSQTGEPAKAAEIMQQLVAAHPDSAEAHTGLGVVAAEAQPTNTEGAIAEFRAALRLDQNQDQARLG